ncbi:unnamed protein product [Rotaria sp. Silwood2]|nr:unnamed protein product [Rotaria sp. Silwood2]
MTSYNSSVILHSTTGKNLTVYICVHLVMPCAVAIGIIGNLLSILVFTRREMIKFCVCILTIILAVSDILLLATSLFNIILPDFFGRSLANESIFWCHFHGYFDILFSAISGYSVVFICVERWFSVWKLFKKTHYVTFKTTLITVIIYISLLVFGSLWFPFALNYNSDQPKSDEKCKLSRPMIYKIFGTISIIFTYVVPFFFLVILNILIVHRLHTRQNTSINRAIAQTNDVVIHDTSPETSSTRKRMQKQQNIDRNITFMLITVAIVFMVMRFPWQIYWLYMQIHRMTTPNITLFILTQTFRYLNCCCNFFLYSATSSLFRHELCEIFQWTHSLQSNHKPINIKDDYTTRPLLNLPFSAIDKDNTPLERENLLSSITITAQTSSLKTSDGQFNIPDSTNGSMPSHKI